jgi:hypothetical protein
MGCTLVLDSNVMLKHVGIVSHETRKYTSFGTKIDLVYAKRNSAYYISLKVLGLQTLKQ